MRARIYRIGGFLFGPAFPAAGAGMHESGPERRVRATSFSIKTRKYFQ